jgi:hypothetical protein
MSDLPTCKHRVFWSRQGRLDLSEITLLLSPGRPKRPKCEKILQVRFPPISLKKWVSLRVDGGVGLVSVRKVL